MNTLKNTFSLGALAVAAAICIPADSANAQLTIVRNSTGGTAPGNTAGGGDLDTIFNAACDWWEVALVTSPAHTLTLNYGWAPKSGGVLASHSLVSQGGTPNRETEGNITFPSGVLRVQWHARSVSGNGILRSWCLIENKNPVGCICFLCPPKNSLFSGRVFPGVFKCL